jgi:hypothetical protein
MADSPVQAISAPVRQGQRVTLPIKNMSNRCSLDKEFMLYFNYSFIFHNEERNHEEVNIFYYEHISIRGVPDGAECGGDY